MILAIIQARASSTRLPGKVLKPLLGVPMLCRQIERVQRAVLVDQIIVATSTEDSDAEIDALCENYGIPCFRGSLNDVLDRFYQATLKYNPSHVIRLTGDCPLSDPQLIDDLVRFYLNGDFDYVSNALSPTFPDGLDVEMFKTECLLAAWKEAKLPSQREHVTPFIYQSIDRFKLGEFRNDVDLSHLRWTVDEPEDFDLVTLIFESLYQKNPRFTWKDVLIFVENNPALKEMNQRIERNEGYKKSLSKDIDFIKN
jgi:spore coat polysaccharide biosynthesis protein SpsF